MTEQSEPQNQTAAPDSSGDASAEAPKSSQSSTIINDGAGSSNSEGYQNPSCQTETLTQESTEKLDEFFDKFASCMSLTEDQKAESVCSDSVSRYAGFSGRNPSKRVIRRSDHSTMASQDPTQIAESLVQQLLTDSASLATLATEKKMSDSRRTFCLFVTFDLILTVLLWLIMCGTSATEEMDFFDIVQLQVHDYTVNHSMFDVVCLAVVRFVFLEICFGLLCIRHWWPVALSTSITDILLILKMFPIFQSSDDADYLKQALPVTVVIILTNFILSWMEVWFLDFKVLPTEAKLAQRTVQHFLRSQAHPSYLYGDDEASERAPLLGSGLHRRFNPTPSYYTGAASDVLSFYTVLDSEFESPHGDHRRGNVFPAKISPAEMCHVEKGRTALNQLWALFNNDGMWKLNKELESGDRLFTADVPGYGKTFRIDTVVRGVSAHQLFHEIVLKAENMPSWNSTVEDVKILRRIGEQTAISLEVSSPAARGLIQRRDFVTVRRVDKINNSYVSAGISTDYPIPDTGRIRGVNGPTGFIVTPCDGAAFNCCKFTWILNTNLKGSLPQYLVNSNLSDTLTNFTASMKRHLGVPED